MPGPLASDAVGSVSGPAIDQRVLPSDLFSIDRTNKRILLKDGWLFGTVDASGVQVYYGTGDPPDPTGLPDGSVYIRYS